jgi:hypothetical protein
MLHAADPRVLEAASEASRRHPRRVPHARRLGAARGLIPGDRLPVSPDWPGATSAILLLSISLVVPQPFFWKTRESPASVRVWHVTSGCRALFSTS